MSIEDMKIHPIPDGWEECEMGKAIKVWLPIIGIRLPIHGSGAVRCGAELIPSCTWSSLGIIPIRKKKREPIEFVVLAGANDFVHGVIYPNGCRRELPGEWIGKKFREVIEDE